MACTWWWEEGDVVELARRREFGGGCLRTCDSRGACCIGRELNGFPMPRWADWLPDMPRRVLGRSLRHASTGLVSGTLRFVPGRGQGRGRGRDASGRQWLPIFLPAFWGLLFGSC